MDLCPISPPPPAGTPTSTPPHCRYRSHGAMVHVICLRLACRMNYRGSYRKLLGNSVSAMLAAIEVYNKPRFPYRDEVVVVLLINAWELMLKAIVSKSGNSIYYPKRRREPYKTISLDDAFRKASNTAVWPSQVKAEPVRRNLELLALYRDKTVHFYNEPDFGVVVYSLAQTSIHNYRDIVKSVFRQDLAEEISWQILPLGAKTPVDPVKYLSSGGAPAGKKAASAVQEFLQEVQTAHEQLKADSARLLTIYSVNLQSTKKLSDADVTVGISGVDTESATIVHKKVDPNKSHPYRQKDVLPLLKDELRVVSYDFLAITYVYKLRGDSRYCWRDENVSLVKWSPDVVAFINKLTRKDVVAAREKYGLIKRQEAAAKSS